MTMANKKASTNKALTSTARKARDDKQASEFERLTDTERAACQALDDAIHHFMIYDAAPVGMGREWLKRLHRGDKEKAANFVGEFLGAIIDVVVPVLSFAHIAEWRRRRAALTRIIRDQTKEIEAAQQTAKKQATTKAVQAA